MRWMVLLITLFVATGSFAGEFTVEDAVRLALKRNPYSKEAFYALEAQKFRKKYTFTTLLPQIDFDYSYTHMKEEPYAKFDFNPEGLPFPVNFPSKFKVGEHQDVKWGIQASWAVFTGFYLDTLYKMEKLGVDVYSHKKRLSEIAVAYAARVAYYGVLMAKRRLETATESVRQLKSHLRDTESFYKNGLVPYNDVLKAKVALARAIEAKTRAEEALKTAWVNFNLVIKNRDIFARHKLKESMAENVRRKILALDRLYDLALSNRPEIRATKKVVEQTRLGIRLARSKYYPWISAFARYQQHGDNLLANNNDYSNRENFLVGLKVNFLVFDWFGRKYKVHEAKSRYLAAESELERLEDQVRLDVQKAYADVVVALRNIQTAKAAVEHAKEDLRITRLQYSQHLASSSDVIDSEEAYTEARNNYYSALYQYHVAIAGLAKACGLVDVKKLFLTEEAEDGGDKK